MIDEDGLNVWFRDQLVGYLWRNDIDYIHFRYDNNWISADGFAISRRLPLQSEAFDQADALAHRFFANLLPEGGAREHLVRDLKIANTDFDLLRYVGGECAGALSIIRAEQQPSVEHQYHAFSDAEMTRLIKRRGHVYGDMHLPERPRLSLAGAQDKCAVLYNDDGYFNPIGDAPSTHILKFESAEYRNLPVYEVFGSWLAASIGLPVVDIELRQDHDRSYVQIARYDRYFDSQTKRIERVHQEDFCQALGYPHARKYQHDGGPSFAECLAMLRDTSDDPAIDTQNLLQWQVFNVLAGNSDGHAKNLSLLYQRDGMIRLAPFYDLVCTRAVDRIDSNLAFDIGGERNPTMVSSKHWQAFAKDCDIGARYMEKLVQQSAQSLQTKLPSVVSQFESVYGNTPALQRIEKVIQQQCRQALRG